MIDAIILIIFYGFIGGLVIWWFWAWAKIEKTIEALEELDE